MSNWLHKAKLNLFSKSVEKRNFSKAKQEWIYYGMVDNKFCGANCHLCCHERIRYEFTIINRLNKQW